MKGTGIRRFAVAIPLLFILVLSLFFHFPIHFENALTLQAATDFGVRISVWRIIFEPFLGPLLYLNRSIYPLEELPIAIVWFLFFFLLFGLLKFFSGRFSRAKKLSLLTRIANLPLLLGICFAIFIVILFIPLPNNTIVNNSRDSVLVTTHAHTEFSHDGLTSQKNIWKWHKRNGFDAFFITDHANHKKSLEFAQKQRNGEFPIQPLILVGQEYSASNHMSLLGLNGKFETKGMNDQAAIDSVHGYGGAVVINHWFDGKGEEKELYKKLGADGFEIENVGKELYYDRKIFEDIKEFCEENDLIMVGGLDFHGYGRVCSLYNAFEIPDWHTMDYNAKERAILKILKNGPQEKLKVLMYKDRPFYTDANLWFRPFLTVVNYFRALNVHQVLSWAVWLLLLQLIGNRKREKGIGWDRIFPLFAVASALFMMILSVIYYFRGEAVKGYSEVYSEYSGILAPVGFALFLYVLAVSYFRFFKRKRKERPQ